MSDTSIDIRAIIGWHCHVYFTPETRATAVRLNDAVQNEFRIWDYRWLDQGNPMHPAPMFRFQFLREDLGRFIEWITLNRDGLSVLVHAITGDNYFDHDYNAIWIGKPLTLDLEGLRRMEAQMQRGELPKTLVPSTQVGAAASAGAVRFQPGDDPHLQSAPKSAAPGGIEGSRK
jgi:DOPA 4,5-dioxygenase